MAKLMNVYNPITKEVKQAKNITEVHKILQEWFGFQTGCVSTGHGWLPLYLTEEDRKNCKQTLWEEYKEMGY